jgi:hypothetical protein
MLACDVARRVEMYMTRSHLFEVFQVPFVVLARPVAWEVCGLRIAYGFGVDLQSLGEHVSM